MLTDMAIKRLKPKEKLYKVADRDGMYVSIATTGQITFRYDYRLNGRRETLTIGRYGADAPMSRATFNRVTTAVVARARKEGLPLEPFTVHDLRRTGSTLLNEMGFNSDWIEKCLAHEDGRSSRGVYNKAEYEPQRRHMLQEWADMIDAWVNGQRRVPTLLPPSMVFMGGRGEG